MKIAFFELESWEEDYVQKNLGKHKILFFKEPLTLKNVKKIKDVDIVSVFIRSELNSRVLGEIKNLKYIITMSTGYDHIDLEYCLKNKIKVSNVSRYGENTVAEHTFALILALARNLDYAIDKTRVRDFSLTDLRGFDLKNKTIGVIGTGNIGENVIKIAKGFEMNVLAFSRKKDVSLSKKYGFKWAENLIELLSKSDIITLHVPLNNKTRHIININNIKKIKKGAFLINTARGELIDTDALIYGLDKRIIAGAGLDVLEGEKDIKEDKDLITNKKNFDWETLLQNYSLLKERNVIVTPHIAFYTKEALERILNTTIDNIESFLKGKVKNKVC